MKYVPNWYELVLLALASYRIFLLISEDKILDWPRRRLLRIADEWEKDGDDPGDDYRIEWGLFITCARCAGWWITVAWVASWLIFGDWVLVAAALPAAHMAWLIVFDFRPEEKPPPESS